LLDARTGAELATLEPPQPLNVKKLEFSTDGNFLAVTCTRRGTLLWDLKKLRMELAELHLDWITPTKS
jgi:hypothetical protein